MKLRIDLLLTIGLLITSASVPGIGEKRLEIQRYPNEPMQLVDLKISGQSVKDRITTKYKTDQGGWSLDTVTFSEADDWYKRVSLTFRNVGDKPIRGVQAFLFFKPAGAKNLFSLNLTNSRNLWNEPLKPGHELELTVGDFQLNSTLQLLKEQGFEANYCEVSFSLDTARYSEKLQWYRGHILHPDPVVPNKWIPVSAPQQ